VCGSQDALLLEHTDGLSFVSSSSSLFVFFPSTISHPFYPLSVFYFFYFSRFFSSLPSSASSFLSLIPILRNIASYLYLCIYIYI